MSIVNNNNILQKMRYSRKIRYITYVSEHVINSPITAYYNFQANIPSIEKSDNANNGTTVGQFLYNPESPLKSFIHLVNEHSFVHEYGHHLDKLNLTKKNNLSDEIDFIDVIVEFKSALHTAMRESIIERFDLDYYVYFTSNVEIFARAYDFYVNVLKLKMSKEEYIDNNTDLEQLFFVNDNLTTKIYEYFSELEKVYNI